MYLSGKCSVPYYTLVCWAVGTDHQVFAPFPPHPGISESIKQRCGTILPVFLLDK